MNVRILLLVSAVFALAGCAETPLTKSIPAKELDLARVKLEPGAARAAINRYRASRGLKPLALEQRLTKAAMRHSSDLARGDRISHTGSDGSNPWDRVQRAGYRPLLAAENVGAGQRSFAEVMRGWKESPGHNKNLLLADATHMGVALVTNPDSRYQTFWTLVLGKPVRAASAEWRASAPSGAKRN